MTRPRPTSHRSRASGYTLLEVMLAIGVFVIGFVAIASIFPAAAMLQKATIQEVESQQFGHSLTAALAVMPSETQLLAAPNTMAKDGKIYPLIAGLGSRDLSYSPEISYAYLFANPSATLSNTLTASVYAKWNSVSVSWNFFAFEIAKSDLGSTITNYPGAVGAAGNNGLITTFQISSGTISLKKMDVILDSLGVTHTVESVDSTGRIITVTDLIQTGTDPATGTTGPTYILAAPAGTCKTITTVSR